MKLSVVIPAKDEEDALRESINGLLAELKREAIDNEIIIINDNSADKTEDILKALEKEYPENIRYLNLPLPGGFGRAISLGLANIEGDIVVTAMADASDDPKDIVKYFRALQGGEYDCAFGSRFVAGSNVCDYPKLKLFINRLANKFIQILFRINHNDITNAFKAYNARVIRGVMPLTSVHFNITVEVPLKAIVRGYTYCTVPINWYGRKSGVSKHKIRELSKKYLYTTLTIWLEKMLLGNEFKKHAGHERK